MRPSRYLKFLIPLLYVVSAAPTTTAPCTCKSLKSTAGKTSTRTVTGSASCTALKLKPTCPTSSIKATSTRKSSSSSTKKTSSTSTKKISTTSKRSSSSSIRTSTSSLKTVTTSSARSTSTLSIKPSTFPTTLRTSTFSAKSSTSSSTLSSALRTSMTSSSIKSSTSSSALSSTLRTSTTSSSSTCVATPTRNAGKRGLSYNDATLTQPFSLSCQNSKVSWAYNWYSSYYAAGTPQSGLNTALTYIPMLWSAASDLTSVWASNVAAAIAGGTDAVLAFNEPDGCDNGGSCMDLASAVAGYQQWMNPLAGQVRLGAPAVTNGASPMGLTYLSNFLGNCTGCVVDFIPIHWYSDASQIADFKAQVQAAYTVGGGRPLWITEFGCTSGTDSQIETFMKTALTWLDGLSYVERYAWFMDRPGYLINANGSGMSTTGQIYNTY